MNELLSLIDESRTRLPDSVDPFSIIRQQSFKRLVLNDDSVPTEYLIYFCTESSVQSLAEVLAYCSNNRSMKNEQSFTFSSYTTLMMNLCQPSSSELFMEEINNSLMLPKTFVPKLKSFTDQSSMLKAMMEDDDDYFNYMSRHQQLRKFKYEHLLCMVGYLLLIAFGKYDELEVQTVLELFAEAVDAKAPHYAETVLKRPSWLSRLVKKTFDDEFGFRKIIFKNLVSLATRTDQLGIVIRLVIQKLQFVKMDKVFVIEKYVKPYCPSILNFHSLEHPLYRSAFIRMDQSLNKFADCEKPFIWFLEEYLDDFIRRGLDLFVAYALAIRSYKQPKSVLPQRCEADWFSENVEAYYDLRKADVFEYLRRYDFVSSSDVNLHIKH